MFKNCIVLINDVQPIMKEKEKAPLECYVITTRKNKRFLLPTIIETIILAIPKKSLINCKPFPLPNHIKDIVTLSPTKIGLFINECYFLK
jgi:hypothetical protein